MSDNRDDNSGLILWLSQQSIAIRVLSFVVFVVLIIALIVGVTSGLFYLNLSNLPRQVPFALADNVTVTEFAVFDDEEAYPAAVASASDGTLYTGSYQHGAVWRVNSNGDMVEIDGTRENIGSVIGLDVASDGAVYILDRIDPPEQSGAVIWQLGDAGLQRYSDIPLQGDINIAAPNDIAVTATGQVFVLDIALGRILLIDETGVSIWWQSPTTEYQIAGLAYYPANDSLLITDALRNAIYEIPVRAANPETELQTIYHDPSLQSEPFFNGIDIAPDGSIYVAALDLNEIWQIDSENDTFTILANRFRGGSDVAYDPVHERLYVNNWDQRWLQPVYFLLFEFNIDARLPFSVDIIHLNPVSATGD